MNYLKAVFWDFPEFTDSNTIRGHLLEQHNQRFHCWLLKRFLEHGRVVYTLQFFRLDTVSKELLHLNHE